MDQKEAAFAYCDAWNVKRPGDKSTRQLISEADDPINKDMIAYSVCQAEVAFDKLYEQKGEILKVGNFVLDNEQNEVVILVAIRIPKHEHWVILEAAVHKFLRTGYANTDLPEWLADIIFLGYGDEANNPVSLQSSNLFDERTLIMTIFERY